MFAGGHLHLRACARKRGERQGQGWIAWSVALARRINPHLQTVSSRLLSVRCELQVLASAAFRSGSEPEEEEEQEPQEEQEEEQEQRVQQIALQLQLLTNAR